jgi:MFS family permease
MTTTHDTAPRRGGTMRVVRSRGALSGFLLVLLGLWGALVPFIGPYFSYAYTPGTAWVWTAGRFWLEVLPGAAAVLAGLMLMTTANRSVGVFAGWLASLAGAWFVVGPVLGRLWNGAEGAAGTPVGGTARQVWEQIGFFSGLGAAVLFLGALALGRFTVTSIRDLRAAEAARAVPAQTQFRDNRAAETARPVAEPVGAGARTAETRRTAETTRPVGGGRTDTARTETVRTETARAEEVPADSRGGGMLGRLRDRTRGDRAPDAVRTEGSTRNDAVGRDR